MKTFDDNSPRSKKILGAVWLIVACLVVFGVGYIDLVTDPKVGFMLFYLLPIVMTAWWWDLLPALLAAVVASGVRFTATLLGHGDDFFSVVLWNSISRVTIFIAASFLIVRLKKDREKLVGLLVLETELARTDSLTRLPNRRGLEEQLKKEISHSRRMKMPLCIRYVDIDNFKHLWA